MLTQLLELRHISSLIAFVGPQGRLSHWIQLLEVLGFRVSLVKVFKTILDIGMDSFGVQRVWMDTGGRWYIILSIACL
jgi:hypothetical protein